MRRFCRVEERQGRNTLRGKSLGETKFGENIPQGLKPRTHFCGNIGTAEAVPFQIWPGLKPVPLSYSIQRPEGLCSLRHSKAEGASVCLVSVDTSKLVPFQDPSENEARPGRFAPPLRGCDVLLLRLPRTASWAKFPASLREVIGAKCAELRLPRTASWAKFPASLREVIGAKCAGF